MRVKRNGESKGAKGKRMTERGYGGDKRVQRVYRERRKRGGGGGERRDPGEEKEGIEIKKTLKRGKRGGARIESPTS